VAAWRPFQEAQVGSRDTALKNRIHATLIAFGHPCPVSDLFGVAGRELLARLDIPEPWAGTLAGSLELIEGLDERVTSCERDLRRLGADHPYVPLLMTAPGIAWILGYTIASEVGDISRFSSPKKLTGYTGLCPRVRHLVAHNAVLTRTCLPFRGRLDVLDRNAEPTGSDTCASFVAAP